MTARRRDVTAAVLAYLADQAFADSGVVVLPQGARWDSRSPIVALVRVDIRGEPRPGPPVVSRGELVLDVLAAPLDQAEPGTADTARRSRAVDELVEALEHVRVPVFDMPVGATTGSLQAGISAAATSCTVVGGAAFQTGTKALLIAGERVTWTGKVDAGADATFSGLTRGTGQTAARAHQAAAPVLDDPGDQSASMELAEASDDDLGWDVAAQRTRSLVRVPFRLDHATA